MCARERMASGQITFTPIGSVDYLKEIDQVLAIIESSGLEIHTGILSTVVRGEKSKVIRLITDIYEALDEVCDFTMDVKISNLCGCNCGEL